MLIGVLSDTHGRVDSTRAALAVLQQRRVSQLIHCGDVGTMQVLDLLAGDIPAAVVWGNCDGDREMLDRHCQMLGIRSYGRLGRLELEGTVISFLHGDDDLQMQSLEREQQCDLLLHGHTHCRDVRDVGRIRVVNPGALHRARPKTVAVIDLPTREVEFIEVGEQK